MYRRGCEKYNFVHEVPRHDISAWVNVEQFYRKVFLQTQSRNFMYKADRIHLISRWFSAFSFLWPQHCIYLKNVVFLDVTGIWLL
jgi:hypothetical protein